MKGSGRERLVQVLLERETERRELENREKLDHKKQAERQIYVHVGRWVGEKINVGEFIPVIRSGKKVGNWPNSDAISPVHRVLTAVDTEQTKEIAARVERLNELKQAMEAMKNCLFSLQVDEISAIQGFAKSGPKLPSLEENIINDIGCLPALDISMKQVEEGLGELVKTTDRQLSDRNTGRGKPRFEAAYAVAYELARLYANVLGERPGFSDDQDGLHGRYTWALNDVFEALGWTGTDLRGPGSKAVNRIVDQDLNSPNLSLGGIFNVSF